MTYATRDDLISAFGQDAVDRLAIRPEDQDGEQTVARALSYADGVINGRISVRFTLPLPEVPAVLRDIACDLAMARMAGDATSLTDDLKHREKIARADLDRVADGKMNLGLPPVLAGQQAQPISASSGGKVFTRDSLRRF